MEVPICVQPPCPIIIQEAPILHDLHHQASSKVVASENFDTWSTQKPTDHSGWCSLGRIRIPIHGELRVEQDCSRLPMHTGNCISLLHGISRSGCGLKRGPCLFPLRQRPFAVNLLILYIELCWPSFGPLTQCLTGALAPLPLLSGLWSSAWHWPTGFYFSFSFLARP